MAWLPRSLGPDLGADRPAAWDGTKILAIIHTSDRIGSPRCLGWLALSHCQTSTLRTVQRRTRPTQLLHTAFLP